MIRLRFMDKKALLPIGKPHDSQTIPRVGEKVSLLFLTYRVVDVVYDFNTASLADVEIWVQRS